MLTMLCNYELACNKKGSAERQWYPEGWLAVVEERGKIINIIVDHLCGAGLFFEHTPRCCPQPAAW